MDKVILLEILESISAAVNAKNIEIAVELTLKKMNDQTSSAETIEDIYEQFTNYVIENVLSKEASFPETFEYWLELMNQLELLNEAGKLAAPKKTLNELLHTIPEMIDSNHLDEALHLIVTNIQEANEEQSRSAQSVRTELIDFISNNMLMDEDMSGASLERWFAFMNRLNSSVPLKETHFTCGLMRKLKAVQDRGDHVDQFNRLLPKLSSPGFENSPIIQQTLMSVLQEEPFKKEIITLFSQTTFGKKLLDITMPHLLKNNIFTSGELYDLRHYFLDTMNKNLFNLVNEACSPIDFEPERLRIDETKINRLKHCPLELADKLNAILIQMPLDSADFNLDDSTAAKYLLTAVRLDKASSYDFHPTIFNVKDFNAYIEEILNAPKPIKESFIIMSSHWTAGEIEVNADGSLNIFISDSLGLNKADSSWYSCELSSPDFLKLCSDRTVNIYYALETRQNAGAGCKIYALDDARHLHTMTRYMDEENVFEYFDQRDSKKNVEINKHVHLKFCSLPDSLLRTMQSKKVHDLLHVDKVNKKGESAVTSAQKEFYLNPQTERIENHRLQLKYQKMRTRLEHHISRILQSDNPHKAFETFDTMADQLTLTGFKVHNRHRLNEQKSIDNTHSFKEKLGKVQAASPHIHDKNTPPNAQEPPKLQ